MLFNGREQIVCIHLVIVDESMDAQLYVYIGKLLTKVNDPTEEVNEPQWPSVISIPR